MLLDLFITHWTEPWEVGEKGFKMLSIQRLVDWSQIRITLVHDGSEKFPEENFKDIPCGVRQICLPHGGIAAARNWCIDHADAKWIKWNDFDDTFANIYALKSIMDVLEDERNHLLWFDLLFEDKPENKRVYLKKERDPIFVHNKVFRRDFLLDNQIRFNEKLTWCEVSSFMALVEMDIDHDRIGRIVCDSPIYMYNVREGSLCNRPEIRFKNLMSFFDRHCYVAEEFYKRGMINEYRTMAVRIMGDSYYTLERAPNITDDKSEHEVRVWKWFDEHRDDFYACKPDNFQFALDAVNREDYDGGLITRHDLMEWIHNHERGEVNGNNDNEHRADEA